MENPEIIGRLLSGMYTFVDGHIYYNNNAIKIRYDIIEKTSAIHSEADIIDIYHGIFDEKSNFKARSNTPLDSIKAHRFGYIIKDQQFEHYSKVLITPYLHERKIFLNRIKKNTKYFYTSIESQESDEAKYNIDMIRLYSANPHVSDNLVRGMRSKQTNTSIIAMNITESKYYVYT